MRISAYLRVSASTQAELGHGLYVQEAQWRGYIERNGHELVEVMREEGVSGAWGSRRCGPAWLKQLQERTPDDAHSGSVREPGPFALVRLIRPLVAVGEARHSDEGGTEQKLSPDHHPVPHFSYHPLMLDFVSLLSPDDDLRVVAALPAGESYTEVDRALREAAWTPCGVGEWAFALRSPSGRYAARISPFDPAAPYSAALYREAAHTRQVPMLVEHRQLEGGAVFTLMEYLDSVPEAEAVVFHRSIAERAPKVAELVDHIAAVHARGASEQPWWGPLDDNPANVMRGADGRLVVTDLFFAVDRTSTRPPLTTRAAWFGRSRSPCDAT